MDLTVDAFVEGLLSQEAADQPSDNVSPENLEMELPDNFDEKLFNQGRRFFWDHSFALSNTMLLGLVALFSVPSILRILVSTRRSNSAYTAYKRYLSTHLHTMSWFEHELKPGSISWQSLYTVRSRHLKAGMAAKLKGLGVVSQRDMALTQFGFMGFAVLKPDKFSVRQLQKGDWDAYIYFWRVIGHMIGLEDRYNICRKSADETRQVCQVLLDRVFTPCLANVPEYFEHTARVMLDGMWCVNPTIDLDIFLFYVRYLADVPGYVYTENDRITFQSKLRKQLEGKPLDTGVDATSLMCKPAVDGLPSLPPSVHYLHDYDNIEATPEYKCLFRYSKFKLAFAHVQLSLYSTYPGRLYFNLNYLFTLFLVKYFPYLAFFRFGVRNSFVNMFVEDPTDDTQLRPNSEYYKKKPSTEESWYNTLLHIIW